MDWNTGQKYHDDVLNPTVLPTPQQKLITPPTHTFFYFANKTTKSETLFTAPT